MPVAPPPSLQCPQQALGVYPVGLHPARPAIYLQARRVHHIAGDPGQLQPALEPEPVVARLKHALDPEGPARAHLRIAPASLEEPD